MGVFSQLLTIMRAAFLFFALSAIAFAKVPETPETEFEGKAKDVLKVVKVDKVDDAKVAKEVIETAKSKLSNFMAANAHLKAEAARNACSRAADASINNVLNSVRYQQRMLNRLSKGGHCAHRGQQLIIRTRNAFRRKNGNSSRAKRMFKLKMYGPIRWKFPYKELKPCAKNGHCNFFYRSPRYRRLKRQIAHWKKAMITSQANRKAAVKVMAAARRSVAVSRKRCYCSVKRNMWKQWRLAMRGYAARKKTILSELMVKCLTSGKHPSRCKRTRVPVHMARRLVVRRPRLVRLARIARCRRL